MSVRGNCGARNNALSSPNTWVNKSVNRSSGTLPASAGMTGCMGRALRSSRQYIRPEEGGSGWLRSNRETARPGVTAISATRGTGEPVSAVGEPRYQSLTIEDRDGMLQGLD